MKSRRRTSIIILVAASVFLCLISSCGIPTPLVPTVSFTKGSTSLSSLTFSVSYKGDGVGNSGKVGLIILYYPDKAVVDSSDNSKIINKFSSNYKVSNYDGIVINIQESKPVYDITTTNTESGQGFIYAFELDGSPVGSPTYTHSMSTTGDFNSSVTISYDSGVFVFSVNGAEESTNLTIDDDINLANTPYLNIYAAISVQSSQYSNIFWSSLSHVGTIRVK